MSLVLNYQALIVSRNHNIGFCGAAGITYCVTPDKNHLRETVQDPVVQNIVSLTSSLRGQLVKCFTTL